MKKSKYEIKKLYDTVKSQNETTVNKGSLIQMNRLGKNGKSFKVFKFRTMYPYSEYLQKHVMDLGFNESGKPKNDFRVTKTGKFLRRYWLDELPQLINVLRGEMKLVGIRPVSQDFFNRIPKNLQKLRLQVKPGCIPPYVCVDTESDLESILQTEIEYLKQYKENPVQTDIKYFFNGMVNIVIGKKRSK